MAGGKVARAERDGPLTVLTIIDHGVDGATGDVGGPSDVGLLPNKPVDAHPLKLLVLSGGLHDHVKHFIRLKVGEVQVAVRLEAPFEEDGIVDTVQEVLDDPLASKVAGDADLAALVRLREGTRADVI